jgi:hypothetical protein
MLRDNAAWWTAFRCLRGVLDDSWRRRLYSKSYGGLRLSGGERATSRNLDAVVDALRRAGVEIEEDGLRLTKKRGR